MLQLTPIYRTQVSNFCLHLSLWLSITRALNLDVTTWQSTIRYKIPRQLCSTPHDQPLYILAPQSQPFPTVYLQPRSNRTIHKFRHAYQHTILRVKLPLFTFLILSNFSPDIILRERYTLRSGIIAFGSRITKPPPLEVNFWDFRSRVSRFVGLLHCCYR